MDREQRRALADPAVQLTLLGEAVAAADLGFLVWDEDRHYVAANQAACRILGVALEELLGSVVGSRTDAGDERVTTVVRQEGGRGELVADRFDGSGPVRLGYVTFSTRTASLPFMASIIWPVE